MTSQKTITKFTAKESVKSAYYKKQLLNMTRNSPNSFNSHNFCDIAQETNKRFCAASNIPRNYKCFSFIQHFFFAFQVLKYFDIYFMSLTTCKKKFLYVCIWKGSKAEKCILCKNKGVELFV